MSLLDSVFNNKFNIMTLIEISEKTGFQYEDLYQKCKMYNINFTQPIKGENLEILMKQYKDGYVLISSKMNF